jgi:Sulfotransferase domain
MTDGVSSASHVLPDFLIIGASRSGTSFLNHALGQHPSIYACASEPHYFDWNFERGPGWYRKLFATTAMRDEVLRRHGSFAAGERSPNYLFRTEVPGRVRQLLPGAKLVVLFRDPVARALSNFHHARRCGIEPLSSFDDAVEIELRQREARRAGIPAPGKPRSYLARGLYAEQLERWLALFDRRQLHLIQSERMFAEPVEVVRGVHRFLGLAPVAPSNLQPLNVGDYARMPAAMVGRLREFYAPANARLRKLLEDPPEWW